MHTKAVTHVPIPRKEHIQCCARSVHVSVTVYMQFTQCNLMTQCTSCIMYSSECVLYV